MDSILGTLQLGLPVLVTQFAVTLGLLGLGVGCYMAVTPFNELRLIRNGNNAAGIVLAGTLLALAIPLSVTLATSFVTLDIVVWGGIALVIQLFAFGLATTLIRGLRGMIEDGNSAAAALLVGVQLAVALLNAGAMAG
jgi:putative membrane protein